MHRPFVPPKDLIGPYGTGRQHFHRAGIIKEIHDPPHGVIMQGARREGLAQHQGGLLVGQALFQARQGTAAASGIEDQAQDNGAWIDGPRGRHSLIDGLDQAHLVSRGFHDGQMLDGVRFDGR